tara:strand:+ start:2178 stop:2279 length:102 start_codon:yes stop_codon:yes gene_type:complete
MARMITNFSVKVSIFVDEKELQVSYGLVSLKKE